MISQCGLDNLLSKYDGPEVSVNGQLNWASNVLYPDNVIASQQRKEYALPVRLFFKAVRKIETMLFEKIRQKHYISISNIIFLDIKPRVSDIKSSLSDSFL